MVRQCKLIHLFIDSCKLKHLQRVGFDGEKGFVVLGEYNLDIQAFAKTFQAYQIVCSAFDEREIKSSVDLDQLFARLFPYSAA